MGELGLSGVDNYKMMPEKRSKQLKKLNGVVGARGGVKGKGFFLFSF
jgi:hypothetical protein